MTTMPSKVHHGKNIKRFRAFMNIKQEAFAESLSSITGEKWEQRKISLLEDKETVSTDLLEASAKVIGVPKELLETWPEEETPSIWNYFKEAIHNNMGSIGSTNIECVFNPIDKYAELVSKLEAAYKDLLAEKDKKFAILEALTSKK